MIDLPPTLVHNFAFYASEAVFAIVAGALGATIILCLPGIWLMIIAALINECFTAVVLGRPGGLPAWSAIGLAVLCAIGAEVVELFAGAAGAKVGGAGRGGIVGAMMGGVVGAVVGTLFIPVPVFGTLGGAVGGAALGAIIGEVTHGKRTLRESMAPAAGAATGRFLGTMAKIPFAIVAWILLVLGAFWR